MKGRFSPYESFYRFLSIKDNFYTQQLKTKQKSKHADGRRLLVAWEIYTVEGKGRKYERLKGRAA